jgi:hypothetical protein
MAPIGIVDGLSGSEQYTGVCAGRRPELQHRDRDCGRRLTSDHFECRFATDDAEAGAAKCCPRHELSMSYIRPSAAAHRGAA